MNKNNKTSTLQSFVDQSFGSNFWRAVLYKNERLPTKDQVKRAIYHLTDIRFGAQKTMNWVCAVPGCKRDAMNARAIKHRLICPVPALWAIIESEGGLS